MAGNKFNINRRKFLYSAFAGMTAFGFRNTLAKNILPRNRDHSNLGVNNKIINRMLGHTGLRVPVVNMGTMNTFDPVLVRRAYELGVRHFDTAAWYQQGRNETMVGNVIKELNVRDKVVIGTKIYIPHQQRNMTQVQVKEAYLKIANESLKRLQTDYVDILYSHDVTTVDWLNHPGIWEALQILKETGKARFIGFSTHSNIRECVEESIRTGFYDVILTAFNYGMNENKVLLETLGKAASEGIGLIAMKTQCTQYHYRQYVPRDDLHYYQGRIMQTAVLKWALRHEFITTAIPGCTTFRQIEDDIAVACDLNYTPEEKQFLEDRNVKDLLGYCLQCKRCIPTCPKGVDIPTLMRTHMYA
jgi:predicted aldo/keto reductase-like oxidoreductase